MPSEHPAQKLGRNHADPTGGGGIHVAAKGTGQKNFFNFLHPDAHLLGQKLDACPDGGLGKLHLPHILLGQGDGAGQGAAAPSR